MPPRNGRITPPVATAKADTETWRIVVHVGLQTGQEHQHDHADFGERAQRLALGHEAKNRGPNHQADADLAYGRGQPEALTDGARQLASDQNESQYGKDV